MSDERDDATASGLVDVVIPPFHWFSEAFRASVPILLLIIPLAILVVPVMQSQKIRAMRGNDAELLAGLVFGAALLPIIFWWQRRRQRRIKAIAEQLAEEWNRETDDVMVRASLDRRPRGSDLLLFQELSRALASRRPVGRAYRLGYAGSLTPVLPIDVSFEPRVLNESDATFIELQDAINGNAGAIREDKLGINARDRQARSMIQRNTRLAGGRWMLVLFALPVLVQALDSYQQRRISFGLVLFSCAFLTILFKSSNSALGLPHAHILPGGIVVAAGTVVHKRKKRLRLLERNRCVLFVVQRSKTAWDVIASDGVDIGFARATQAEADMLLRAWLSPIAAPPEEMVVNMVFQNKKEKSN